ncbi:MAG: hypothetical protein ACLPN6_12850 [Streptosporangiaceae bacterium]
MSSSLGSPAPAGPGRSQAGRPGPARPAPVRAEPVPADPGQAEPGPAHSGPAEAAAETARPSPGTRALAWAGAGAILLAILIMIAASLAHGSWMDPRQLPMPAAGPPWELHVPVPPDLVTAGLWVAAVLGGAGVLAALAAVRRGFRVSVRAVLITAFIAVAVLTVLPPVGSTDALDYAAYGRIALLGHSPYVVVPAQLRLTHDAIGPWIPFEWQKHVTLYGPAATVEQLAAARLGGTSMARITFWLKLWNSIAFGAVAFAADRLLRSDPVARLRAHLLWTINPLLLWGLIASGHIDTLGAAFGLLGLLLIGTRPGSAAGRAVAGPLRALAAGLLIGVAADIKISFLLFAAGLAWALRRSPIALTAAACGSLAVLVPTYAWFGPPAVRALLQRTSKVTIDNFYQLVSKWLTSGHYLVPVAAVLVLTLAVLMLWRMPRGQPGLPAIRPALALTIAWLFVWPYQLPWYDAMLICLLVLYPASRLDWLVLIRLTAGTTALMPGNPTMPHSPLLASIARADQHVVVPLVLLGVTIWLVVLCVTGRWKVSRPAPPDAAIAASPAGRTRAVQG